MTEINRALDVQQEFADGANETARKSKEPTVREVDQALVDRFNRGDNSAHDVLQLKYQRKIQTLILKNFQGRLNVADAEELTQDIFLKSFEGLKNFRGDSAYYTWLYRIAVNTAKNELVRRRAVSYTHLTLPTKA